MDCTLYYFHDPMCSWCYAFNASLQALAQALPEPVRLEKVVGGLAPDTMEPMPMPLAHKIQQTWRRIEQTIPGVRFNFDFWLENTPIRSTYPACRAVLAAKKQGAVFEDRMISAIQNAYYRKAENPSLPETLLRCAQQAGLNVGEFSADLAGDAIEHELQKQIDLARRLGVVSFPSLRLKISESYYPIEADCLDHQNMLDTLAAALKETGTLRDWQL
ncbi:MAG: DsbA family protein [Gammaproteobacteria bacterium]